MQNLDTPLKPLLSKQMNLSEITPNEKNPRLIKEERFKKLVRSLENLPDFTAIRAIILDEDKKIIGGNMRFRAMQHLGWKTGIVQVYDREYHAQTKTFIELGKSYEDACREMVIRDNVSFGENDFDILANEYDPLELDNWGLDVWQPEEEEEVEGLTDPDEVPASPEEPKTKLGDLYILGEHRLLCGDSTKAEAVEKLMNGEKADTVFTDPPYNLQQRGQTKRTNKTDSKREDFGEWDVCFNPLKVLPHLIDFTQKNAHIFICTSNYLFGEIHENLEERGLKPNYLVWCKKNPMPSLAKNRFVQATELIIHAVKGSPLFKYPKGENLPNFFIGNVEAHEFGHPTQKPIYVIENCVKHTDGILLDLFLGSGSTLIAAEKTGRKCYGMELDPKYCDVIVKRWEDFTGKKAELWKQ